MVEKQACIVIFGYSLKGAHQINQAMVRRVAGALKSAVHPEQCLFLATGGQGRFPPSEASLMARQLKAHGVSERNILREDASRNTLDSVIHCANIIRQHPRRGPVVVCTDRYHLFRCRLLLLMLGVQTVSGPVESGYREAGPLRWVFYYLREIPALLMHGILLYPMLYWINNIRGRRAS